MDKLWAPWRMGYILSDKAEGCIFCDHPGQAGDDERYIFLRSEHCFALLNLYPYNNGHCMVVPYEHKNSITLLSPQARSEIMETVSDVTAVLTEVLQPDGFNMGINQGRTAGAGVDKHVHFHIVPRWNGDTNFMPVLGETKILNDSMETLFTMLKNRFSNG